MLNCRNTRGYTIGGHARDRSRDRRLRIVHSLPLVQITQYLYRVITKVGKHAWTEGRNHSYVFSSIYRSTRRHYKAIHLKVISYFRERLVRGEFAPKSYSPKKKELGYMRKDFDPDQLRLLLMYRPERTIVLVSLSNYEWITRSYYRRKSFTAGIWTCDLQIQQVVCYPLSHSATASQQCYALHVPNKVTKVSVLIKWIAL